jgi:hypothetical protein
MSATGQKRTFGSLFHLELQMKLRPSVAMTALLYAGTSSAMSECPQEAKDHCGRNPFHVLAVSLSDVCTEIDPEHRRDYEKQLEKFATNEAGRTATGSDRQFLEDVKETKQKLRSADPKEVREACRNFRTEEL